MPVRSLLAFVITLFVLGPAHAATTVYVNGAGCGGVPAPCFTTIQAGVDNAGGGSSTVFIYPGTYNESVDISDMGSSDGAQGALTLQAADSGGSPAVGTVSVVGSAGGGSLGEAFYNSSPFGFSVTLNGINVTSNDTDAIDFESVDGATLNDVTATGAVFDGVDIRTTDSVIINRSTSSGNGNDGFEILFDDVGNLTVTNSTANDNGGLGDGDDGFDVEMYDGSISFTDVEASRNGSDGIEINPRGVSNFDPAKGGSCDVIVAAVEIDSVTLTRVTLNDNGPPGADENEYDGLELENDIKWTGCSPDSNEARPLGDVRIIDSVANGNEGAGFEVYGVTNGEFEVTGSTASFNGHDGFQLDPGDINTSGATPPAPTVAIVTLATVRDVVANSNGRQDGGDGIAMEIHSDCFESRFDDIVLENITTNDNADDGIEATADGSIIATSIEANRNGFGDGDNERDGIELGRTSDSAGDCAPSSLVVRDVVTNGNAGDGTQLQAGGSITAENITANDNGNPNNTNLKDGIDIDNNGEGPGGDIVLRNCVANNNEKDGVNILPASGITVTVENCQVVGNGADGIDTINNLGIDDDVSIPGDVFISLITAADNGDDGIDTGAEGTVTILDSCVELQRDDGMAIKLTDGDLDILRSTSYANGDAGINLDDLTGGVFTIGGVNIIQNREGVTNVTNNVTVAASSNYWGSPSGPTHPGNPGGNGDLVLDGANGGVGTVQYAGFLGFRAAGSKQCPSLVEIPTVSPVGGWVMILLLGLIGVVVLRRG